MIDKKKEIWIDGLSDEQRSLHRAASTRAIAMANWLGIDSSDVGYTFSKDEDGIWCINFTVTIKEKNLHGR